LILILILTLLVWSGHSCPLAFDFAFARVGRTLLSDAFDFDLDPAFDLDFDSAPITDTRTTVEERRRFQRRVKLPSIQAGFSPSSLSADAT